MRKRYFMMHFLIFVGLITFLLTGSGGCGSTPPAQPDMEKIKRDADKGMRDLEIEENR